MRTVFMGEGGQTPERLREKFTSVAHEFAMDWQIHDRAVKPKVLLLVSKFDHCLHELLYQYKAGTLQMQVMGIVSNHMDLKPLAELYKLPYHHLPVTPQTKLEQEQQIYELVKQHNIDLVVLARYMQILSDALCGKLEGKAINIHHSFLPSFKGAKPYHQAHRRGVKVIGATAHYVTRDLDEGPIIEQETTKVNHTHTPGELIEIGRHLESLVLSRAVKYHLEHRVILNGSKTIVLDSLKFAALRKVFSESLSYSKRQ